MRGAPLSSWYMPPAYSGNSPSSAVYSRPSTGRRIRPYRSWDAELTREQAQAAERCRGELGALAAQAADELLNISGIDTSFVLYPQDGVTYISARSLGDANVQVILEPLGGGGNAATAGAQVKNHTVQQTLDELLQSINKFYES